MLKVKIGDLVTKITESQLQTYLDNGWELVVSKDEPLPTNYDNYTEAQLGDIAKVRGINFDVSQHLTRDEMIKALVHIDNQAKLLRKPTNEGFTDGLIID